MKALIPILAGCLAAIAAPAASQLTPIDESGLTSLLKANRGKVVLVDLWATWCGPCREELPVLAQLQEKLRNRGFVLITISADEPEQRSAAHELLKQHGLPMPAYIKQVKNDEDFINFIDRKWSGALPALFLYDRNGERVQSFIGESSAEEIEAAVRKLL